MVSSAESSHLVELSEQILFYRGITVYFPQHLFWFEALVERLIPYTIEHLRKARLESIICDQCSKIAFEIRGPLHFPSVLIHLWLSGDNGLVVVIQELKYDIVREIFKTFLALTD